MMKKLVVVLLVVSVLLAGCVQDREGETTTTTQASFPPTTTTTKATTTSTTTQSTTTTTRPVVLNPKVGLSVSTDKGVYRSNELMNIAVVMDSSDDLVGVKVRIYGIMARYYRIDKTEEVDLNAGLNEKGFSYKTPPCYGCAGITPGAYNVTVDVIYNDEVIASSTTEIEMQQ